MVILRLCVVLLFLPLLIAPSAGGDLTIPPRSEAGEGGYLQSEFIYPLAGRPTPQCHASTIVETDEGLVAAWFGGTREKHPDVGIWLSRHRDGQWTAPVELVDGSEQEAKELPCWNPVLFQAAEGPLYLFYKVGPNPRLWWGMMLRSEDAGKTWSRPEKLGRDEALPEANPHLLGPVKNKPIARPDGTILCPSSTENAGWRVHFERFDPASGHWQVIGPIHDASRFDAIQPSILIHDEQRLQVLCRSRQNVLVESWSEDGGQSWGPVQATSLPNPNAGTDAVTLQDGRHLLVYNHTTRQGDFPRNREMLNVAVSQDGKDWQPVLTLERSPGEYSYPAVIQTSEGRVHVTYTWQRQTIKHVVLDPARLAAP